MSWDCPYWNSEICELNGMACKPGKGQCVLRKRYEIISPKKTNKDNCEKNDTSKTNKIK